MPVFPFCPHKDGGRTLSAIGAEHRMAPSPGSPRRRGSRLEVRWPDSRLFAPPVMLPASSSTTPTSWQTSLVFQPWTPSRPLTSRADGPPGQDPRQTKGHHLGPRARSVDSDGQHPNPATLSDILASLRALVPHAFAGGLHQTQVAPAPTAATTPLQTPPGRTKPSRSPRTRSETGRSLRSPLPHGLPRPQSTGTGRPVRAVAFVASDVEKTAHHLRAKGKAASPGRAP